MNSTSQPTTTASQVRIFSGNRAVVRYTPENVQNAEPRYFSYDEVRDFLFPEPGLGIGDWSSYTKTKGTNRLRALAAVLGSLVAYLDSAYLRECATPSIFFEDLTRVNTWHKKATWTYGDYQPNGLDVINTTTTTETTSYFTNVYISTTDCVTDCVVEVTLEFTNDTVIMHDMCGSIDTSGFKCGKGYVCHPGEEEATIIFRKLPKKRKPRKEITHG